MATIRKRFVVELSYTDSHPCNEPYVKDWWARQQVEKAIEKSIPYQNERINDVEVKLSTVEDFTPYVEARLQDLLTGED